MQPAEEEDERRGVVFGAPKANQPSLLQPLPPPFAFRPLTDAMSLHLRVLVGDISSHVATAIAVSSNQALAGAQNPSYWRFAGRRSTNNSVREKAGPELALHCIRLGRELDEGEAVSTPAFDLRSASHIIHANVPDGMYVTPGGNDKHLQTLELPVLRRAFASVLEAAAASGADSVAIPALGCGVLGWSPGLSAGAAAAAIKGHAAEASDMRLRRVDLVLATGGMRDVWRGVFERELGLGGEDGWRL